MELAGASHPSPRLLPSPRRESSTGPEPQRLVVRRLGQPGRVPECVSEAITEGRGICKLSHLPLLLGPRSPSEHPGNIGAHGAPSQHDSCGLVPGVSGTRMGTLCSPLRHYCSSAGPAGEPDPWASSESLSDRMGHPSLTPCTAGALHRAQKGGAPWEDSAENTVITARPHAEHSANRLFNPHNSPRPSCRNRPRKALANRNI